MPEPLKRSEVEKGQDPSVAKQWDDATPLEEKFKDFAEMADGIKVGILGTLRNDIGPVGRAMAVAKRSGPDFFFLANANSQKFDDIESNKVSNIYFHDSKTQDWISVTGETVTSSNTDARIKEVYSKPVSAWFGDLKDGIHDGGPDDPRMKLIEVKAKYISYWKHTTGALGMAKEIGGALLTGGVANTGVQRQLTAEEIAEIRQKHGSLSS